MSGPGIGGPSGDLFDADMGDDVHGGMADFDPLRTHHSIYGYDRHFSWDDEPDEFDPLQPNNSIHGTDHGDGGRW